MHGALILEDGKAFKGQAFGRGTPGGCEVVCVVGAPWHEVLASPAYAGQIVVAMDPAAPGASFDDGQAASFDDACYPRGLILNGTAAGPSTDCAWQLGLTGLRGVDTGALAAHLKRTGPLAGRVVGGGIAPTGGGGPGAVSRFAVTSPVEVSTARPYRIYGGGSRIVLYDFGVSPELLAWFVASDCHITVVPWDYPAHEVMEMLPDAVILSGGPGNPAACDEVVAGFRPLIGELPLLGVGLGHQLLARAQGGRTGRMWCGHRSKSIAVRDLDSGRIYDTSQSHGYTVLGAPVGAKVTHVAVDDGSIEGLAYPNLAACSVQFLPGSYSPASQMAQLWRRLLATGEAAGAIA